MSWGRELKTLLAIREASGITPPALAQRPNLKPQYRQLYRDFDMLHRGRASGVSGPAALSFQDMAAYLGLFPQATQERAERWIRIMQAADAAVLEKMYEKLNTA